MINIRFYDTIISPVIAEKSTLLAGQNQVVFNVKKDSSKSEIKSAVEALFSVKVVSVNTLIRKGKVKRLSRISAARSRVRSSRDMYVSRKDVKRAFVTLAKGYSIDISAGV
ncbi:50S ribosomal protein L23 [Candidatus Liberibacter asiaticus]|uniref:Large ribosomal subunit protein uL23 n=2 Tax=Liberibacter asiaticus TaxID=34021 RepID=C6XHI9_LIBAP|nr:50S ribosomal protein L23 [Candidatus Liberibacter asiaticus]ACT56732.1 50S ribosomal protein L23 [Candidatus Liberibacter asiaticus str. psy62]AGH16499.1 50S ribosomal protein L23 [Candidatus Liberibacter asiaticus str. gxpsy]ALK06899.1 50S ribosomal protein L23 [Candidatus Liberibacter asiaticus]ASK52372.1 50S ribosomal protein L23 [Candidatus Liberibacter asiaticus]AWL13693.1 50S ribosomal protein L23 [Candidatus Liberibacter asiaticus]